MIFIFIIKLLFYSNLTYYNFLFHLLFSIYYSNIIHKNSSYFDHLSLIFISHSLIINLNILSISYSSLSSFILSFIYSLIINLSIISLNYSNLLSSLSLYYILSIIHILYSYYSIFISAISISIYISHSIPLISSISRSIILYLFSSLIII